LPTSAPASPPKTPVQATLSVSRLPSAVALIHPVRAHLAWQSRGADANGSPR
jgi:hypothetical protein